MSKQWECLLNAALDQPNPTEELREAIAVIQRCAVIPKRRCADCGKLVAVRTTGHHVYAHTSEAGEYHGYREVEQKPLPQP